jgi:hypothetical protein
MARRIAARSTLETTDQGGELRIASFKGGLVVLLIWLPIMTYVVADLIKGQLHGGEQGPWVVISLAVWVGGVLVLLWCAIGSERLVFGEGQLTVARALGPFAYQRRAYPLNECSRLRVVGMSDRHLSWDQFYAFGVVGPGTAAFDCDGQTVTFGLALKDRDAEAIVSALEPLFGGHLTSSST